MTTETKIPEEVRATQELTDEVLTEMLQENTGRSLLDSGGTPKYDEDGNYAGSKQGYGRHWERNQAVEDFHDQSAVDIEVYPPDEILIYVNVFHWLRERLSFSPRYDALFYELLEEEIDPDNELGWMTCMKAFPEAVENWSGEVAGELGGWIDADTRRGVTNTYNGECHLSQTLQFITIDIDGDPVVGLQIHNGADVETLTSKNPVNCWNRSLTQSAAKLCGNTEKVQRLAHGVPSRDSKAPRKREPSIRYDIV